MSQINLITFIVIKLNSSCIYMHPQLKFNIIISCLFDKNCDNFFRISNIILHIYINKNYIYIFSIILFEKKIEFVFEILTPPPTILPSNPVF